jgi:hypothetical protein
MRKGKHCSLKVRSVYLLVILKMSKVIDFFNHIVMQLFLEEMLNLIKISWPTSLIWRLCLLRPASHLRQLCLLLFLFWFLLQMMKVRMKIHLRLLDIPPDESFEPEQAPVPPLPRWVCSTREAVGDLVSDPSDQRQTRSQFQGASSLLAQVSETHDPETFVEASGHPDWDTTMNEEYRSLMENDTWDLVPLPKGRKLVRCKWVYRTKYASDGSIERHKA